jgi:hypothetical protein
VAALVWALQNPTDGWTRKGDNDGHDLAGRLQKLAALRETGALTDAEFESAKRQLLHEGDL